MTSLPRIALDMDSVIADNMPLVNEWLANNGYRMIRKHEINNWNWIQNNFKLTSAKTIEAYSYPWTGVNWERLQPNEPNIRAKIEELKGLSKGMMIVTSASLEQVAGKMAWFKKQGLDMMMLFVPFGKTKEDLDFFDVFIDDRGDTIENVVDNGKIGILYDQPWNQEVKKGIRVKNLSEAINHLNKLKGENHGGI